MLIVATDRLSAFDVVLPYNIPNKGKVLTQLSTFWFEKLEHIVPNHILSVDTQDFPEPFRSSPEVFAGRSMLVQKAKPFLIECVVRGYIAGSGWKDYQKTDSICGIKLPPSLCESDRLPEPIFTSCTKAGWGLHDENISLDEMTRIVGKETGKKLRELTLLLYTEGAEFAETRGIIIADTKFEFGIDQEGKIMWIDEALTPEFIALLAEESIQAREVAAKF